MTSAHLIGLAPEFANVDVTISRPTLLGRALPDGDGKIKLTPDVDCYLPQYLRGSTVDSIVAFGPGTDTTSRNHALIYPVNDRFMLTDLGSTNGTFYSFMDEARRLFHGATYLLRDHDTIHLGNPQAGIRFQIEYASAPAQRPLPLAVRPAVVEKPQPLVLPSPLAVPNYALLVGSQGNLNGVENDVAAIKRTLETRRGFHGNIETLLGERANFNAIVHHLEKLERRTTPESLTVFYYTGHGLEHTGDLDLYGPAKISPFELYLFLRDIRGRKVVIIDACYSAHFADEELLPPETLVLTSSRKEAYEGEVAGGKKMGYFTRALTELIDSSRPRLNLKDLQQKVGTDVKLVQKGQEPQVAGATIYIGTQLLNVDRFV